MEEKLFFDNGKGTKLCGVLTSSPDTNSIAILCHGLNSGKDSNTNLALEKILSKHYIATFRFDFYAHKESEGKIEDRSVEEFATDVLHAVALVRNRGYSQIGVFGSSFGGIAAAVAASRNYDIKCIALKAAGMSQTSRTMPNYKHDFEKKSWINAAENITIPALIVHGDADKDVELELGKQLAKAIKNSRFEVFAGADHRFTNNEDFDRSTKLLAEFLIKHLAS